MSKSNMRIAVIALTVVTILIHLSLLLPPFLANAVGYAVLLVIFFKWLKLPFLAGRDKMVWYVFMGYTALTIVLYFVVNGGQAFSNPMGLVDKAAEVLLLAALWLHKDNSA
jgi:hypothetical protein